MCGAMTVFRAWLCRCVFIAHLLVSAETSGANSKPKIVFILADDLGYGDLGCFGQRNIRTPRLDQLASEGIRFTQFYAGSTVCAPSRSVLMQGLHTGHCRVRGNAGRDRPLAQALRMNDITVAKVLKEAGYTCGLFGKWGLGDAGEAEVGLPGKHGFDEFFGYLSQVHAHNYYPTFLWRNEERVPLRNTVPNETPAGAGRSDNRLDYSPDLILNEALSFIRRHADKPFFLYYTPTLPHANNEARQQGTEIPDLGEYRGRDWPEPVKGHAAMVTHLDRGVGRILDLLTELGLGEDTIVFFTSDNGPHKEGGYDPDFNDSNGPWRGIKRDLTEGGIRVPMIVRWPGRVPAGKTSDALWWFADFLPTAAAIAEVHPPPGLDGVSVVPLLEGRQGVRRRAPLYWEFHELGFRQAVRSGRWKAIRDGKTGAIELYDLRRDPGESQNLASKKPSMARRMTRQMDEMRTPSPDWPVAR